jgi:hypothetical protein
MNVIFTTFPVSTETLSDDSNGTIESAGLENIGNNTNSCVKSNRTTGRWQLPLADIESLSFCSQLHKSPPGGVTEMSTSYQLLAKLVSS